MISLNQKGSTVKEFQLNLLKEGNVIINDFRAPNVVWKMEHIKKGVDKARLMIHHKKMKKIELDSSYFLLSATYESIGEKVCVVF